jgi:hypothetical protein
LGAAQDAAAGTLPSDPLAPLAAMIGKLSAEDRRRLAEMLLRQD